jgi:hypothetical protein
VASPKKRAEASRDFLAARAEEAAATAALTTELIAQYQPVGVTENLLIQDMARYVRRKQFALRLEAQANSATGPDLKTLRTIERLQKTTESSYSMALNSLKKLQQERAKMAARKPRLVFKGKKAGE